MLSTLLRRAGHTREVPSPARGCGRSHADGRDAVGGARRIFVEGGVCERVLIEAEGRPTRENPRGQSVSWALRAGVNGQQPRRVRGCSSRRNDDAVDDLSISSPDSARWRRWPMMSMRANQRVVAFAAQDAHA